MGNPSPMLDSIGAVMVSEIHGVLSDGTDPWGMPHEPLKLRDGVPLNDTRQHIYNRITHSVSTDSVTVGMLDSPEHIGQVQQFGTMDNPIKPKKGKYLRFKDKSGSWHALKEVKIPPRPFFPIRSGVVDLPEAWEKEIKVAVKQSLVLR